ncbi:MAG: glycerophosphodiester phosphodiesterase family protein [Candidatus Cryptobacteroides sp.]
MKRILLIGLAALGLAACQNTPEYANRAEAILAQIHNPKSDYVVVACHRGDWRNFPENSALAIESIINMGADIMELDLKMSKDSVLVLSHDRTLDRCTNGKGPVSDYTLEELKQFKLKRAHGVATDTCRILTLEEALWICKDRICVNVDQGYEFYDQVLEISERLGVTDQLLIKGKRPIDVVAEHEARHEHNMMYMPIVDIQKPAGIELYKSYMERNVVPLAYEVCWQTEDGTFDKVCEEIIAQGSKIWVNTIWASLCGGIGNDDDAAFISGDPEKVYRRYLDKGVSMIQTDRPELLIGYLTRVGRHTLR